jgi:transcription-repair coupling factor (superfamily II helicase)
VLPEDSRKRLRTLEEYSELGSGFQVAMRDLDIRGAGNLLGAEQSGFIADMGFDMYHKILDEAVQELKQDEFDSMLTAVIPDGQDIEGLPSIEDIITEEPENEEQFSFYSFNRVTA